MSFVLNEEEQMLRDSARSFLAETSPVTALRALRDGDDTLGYAPDLWTAMGEMGWTGVLVSEDHGGVDFGYAAAGLVLEEIGRTLTASPFLSTSVLAAAALRTTGSEAQQAAWLPRIAAADAVIALAIDEKARHDPDHVETRAEADGNGFRLSGTKRFVQCGMGAHAYIVTAKTDDGAVKLFLVDASAEGVGREGRRTVDSHVPADVTFTDVRLDGGALMDGADDAGLALALILDAGRAGQAAESLGVAEAAFEMTVNYLKEREQFGVPIGSFQGLQHRAAHLLGEIELARSLVMKALRTLDEQPSQAALWCAAAKAKATQVSRLAGSEGIQMYGGVGMTDEYDIGLYYKRAQAAGEFLGDESWGSGRVAHMLGL